MKQISRDAVCGVALILIAGLVGLGTAYIPVSSIGRYGARLVPGMVAAAIAALGMSIFLEGRKNTHGGDGNRQEIVSVSRHEKLPVRLTFLILALYVFGIESVGFPIMTFLYLVMQMYILSCFNTKRIPAFLLISGLGTALIHFVFRSYFHVLLPAGILE